MEKINALLFITPKTELMCLTEDMSVRQAIEKMKVHSYMATPVISRNGEYLGTITEGDLLWKLVQEKGNIEALENINIKKIIRKDYNTSVKVDVDTQTIASIITEQNFIPVVDDRNILMGIITRKKILKELLKDKA